MSWVFSLVRHLCIDLVLALFRSFFLYLVICLGVRYFVSISVCSSLFIYGYSCFFMFVLFYVFR